MFSGRILLGRKRLRGTRPVTLEECHPTRQCRSWNSRNLQDRRPVRPPTDRISSAFMTLSAGTRLGPYEILVAARRGRDGRGLPGAGLEAEARRGGQGTAAVARRRP